MNILKVFRNQILSHRRLILVFRLISFKTKFKNFSPFKSGTIHWQCSFRPVPLDRSNVPVTSRTFNFNVKPHFDKGKAYVKLSKGIEIKIHKWGVETRSISRLHRIFKIKTQAILQEFLENQMENMSITNLTSNLNGLQHVHTYIHSFNNLYMNLKRVTRVDLYNIIMKFESIYIKAKRLT